MTENKENITKAVIITGTSSGLGFELCNIMLDENCTVFSISRRFLPEQLSKAKSNNNLVLLKCDLSKSEQVKNCVSKLEKSLIFYTEVIFINNAGVIDPLGFIVNLDNKAIEEAITINLTSPIIISKMLIGLPKSKVKVINISTGAAKKPILGWPMYCASKAGAKMFFDILEAEAEAGSGRLTVISIDPGAMDTDMQSSIRSLDQASCPTVGYFKDLHVTRKLFSSYDAAKSIVERCCL
jgi:benzil reductase ((S)-benzoin forming)